ncbi:MAG: dolichyl-phosphate beta-glucosyltransferase [Patescibacteria group bacterium]
MTEFSIVIPAYNEESRIISTLTQTINFMNSFSDAFEIIVVDDGSSDSTVDIVSKYAKERSNIKLIQNSHKGKGYAVRTGVLNALGEYILLSDADMATPIEELKRLHVWMKDSDFDVVIASREGVGARRNKEPFIRHLMGRIFNMMIRLLLVPEIQDTQCGFKLFKKKAAYDIFRRLVLYGENAKELKHPRVTAFDVEVLFVARKLNYRIKEVPVTWTYDAGTKVNKIRDSIVNFIDILTIKVNSLQGKYN